MSIFVTADTQNIAVPWQADLANLIPHAREFAYQGARMLVFPNAHIEAKLARNVGIPVPAPILTKYDWANTTPWEIQKTTAALLTESERCYVLSSMGVGKTRAVLYAYDYLRRLGIAAKLLVSAPLSTLTPVWEAEIFRMMLKYRVKILHGSREKRLRLLAEPADVYVINHHGMNMLQTELVAAGFDTVVIDELAILRNKSTQLWKAAKAIIDAPSVQRAWGLTGSPTPNAPTDAWAQVRLLTPARTVRTMSQFRDLTMRQVSTFRWVARPEANDIVRAAMQPSVRFTREDIAELPPTTYVDRDVKLDPDATKAYKLMFDKLRIMTAGGENVSAVNEGVLQSKLLQIACGFLYTDTKGVYALPMTGRLRALEEIIAETDRKVIVFVPFIAALTNIANHLRAKGHDVAVIYGGTARGQRDKIFRDFQNETNPRILVAHPGCMSHGLTLTAANTIVWFTSPYSNEQYEQSNARIVRPSQTSRTLIVHMSGTPVERITYARLKARGRMQGVLLDLFRSQDVDY